MAHAVDMAPFWEYAWRRVPDVAVEMYKEIEPKVLEIWQKEASWPRRALELIQVLPAETPLPLGIPSNPSPLAGMLTGGLAGAGLGYGLGYLGEKLLPESWHRGRLRRTGALLGGALGALPGATVAGLNLAGGQPWNDPSSVSGIGYNVEQARKLMDDYWNKQDRMSWDLLSKPEYDALQKTSAYPSAGIAQSFAFDPEDFNEAIWSDPRVSGRLDPPVQAAASGLVTGASNLPGKGTKLVTPLDIGRIAAGMGSGYLSGMLVGKALGALMGMPDKTQDRLRDTGMWAGIIANVVPIAFGAR